MEMEYFAYVLAGLALGLAPTMYFLRRVSVPPGHALLVTGGRVPKVYFDAVFLWSIRHRSELLDLRVQTLRVRKSGKEGLLCRNNIRVDVSVVLSLCISKDVNDIILVAQTVGAERASKPSALEALFQHRVVEAMRVAFKKRDFHEVTEQLLDLAQDVIDIIGPDLNGYHLESLSIESVEQTPIELLDPKNIQDAEGIRKINERTAMERIVAAELEQ